MRLAAAETPVQVGCLAAAVVQGLADEAQGAIEKVDERFRDYVGRGCLPGVSMPSNSLRTKSPLRTWSGSSKRSRTRTRSLMVGFEASGGARERPGINTDLTTNVKPDAVSSFKYSRFVSFPWCSRGVLFP